MSIRLSAIIIIVITNLVIILFSVSTGAMLVSRNIKSAQEADMNVVADIADRYISNEIELLHLRASDLAKELAMSDESQWDAVLNGFNFAQTDFIGAAVFDIKQGRLVFTGEAPPPVDALETTHIAQAFEGKKTLNTTYFYNTDVYTDPGDTSVNPNSAPGDVVFYAAVALPASDSRLLCVTIPGVFFHDKLENFVIWETGHVFMIDTKGAFVSNPREHWVYQRANIPALAAADSGFAALAETAALMASGDAGIGYYTVYGVPRVCAYKPVSGSQDGWSLGTVAPLPESPFRSINTGLVAAGSMGLFLGLIAAIIGSGFIKKPFEKVKALQEESELNSKYKSQFLANMSHEMRTPLTSVIGLTELTLRTVRLDDETHHNLVKVYRAGETLLGLINDILDISKIEANRFELNESEYDLPSMLNDTITQSLLYLGEKPVELVLDIPDNLPRRLYGDELRVKQIFNNLLSNAFKFTKEGTVKLSVRCEKENEALWLTAEISDTGIGIKQQDFEKLFTLYANMDKENKTHDTTRRIEGTGLGLSICKKICEMMNGFISVQSEYGKGSVFTFKLRQGYISDAPIGANVVESLKNFHYSIDKFKGAEKSRINLSYARVLVVDDNTANLDVAKGLMSLYGMTVDCVTGGRLAIEAIQEERVKYNAVFMDHMMPEIDGIEATRLIREIGTDYALNIPIIALTANAVIGNEEMFLNKGFQAFIAKPIDLTRLDNILRQWVRDKDAEAQQTDKWLEIDEKPEEASEMFGEIIPGLEVGKCLAHFVKESVFTHVLQSFAKSTAPLLDKITQPMPESLSEYAVTVHGIKGAARGIYAEELGNTAQTLESAAKSGDYEYVSANNQSFIENARKLIEDIEKALSKWGVQIKPVKEKPDEALLAQFLSACDSYDIDEMDSIMTKIDEYEYKADDGLAKWLRSSLEQGQYKLIKEKLSVLITKNKEK